MRETSAPNVGEARRSLASLAPPQPVEVSRPGEIGTSRLLLRPLCESDLDEFRRVIAASREHLRRFSELHLPGESDVALFRRQMHLTTEGERTGRACRRVAIARDGRIVGAFNLNAIRRGLASEADCNWWIAGDALRNGYATEGLAALLAHALADLPEGLGLHSVLAAIQPENEASRSLAERLGFRSLGPERTYVHAGGKWDLHEMYRASPESVGGSGRVNPPSR